jgi:hypothetical protein
MAREAFDNQPYRLAADVRVDGTDQLIHGVAATLPCAEPRSGTTRKRNGCVMKKRTTNILLGVLGVFVVGAVILVAAGAWFALSVFHRQTTDEATAIAAFESARARFKGTMPVFEFRSGEPAMVRPVPAGGAQPELRTMHFIVWEPTQESLTRADVPLGLLRLTNSSIDVFRFVDRGSGRGRQQVAGIRLSDLDRFGSTVLVDHQTEDGQRILVWTE